MTSEFWLWLDTVAMLVGGVAILLIGKQRTGHEQAHTIFHGIVPIIAACSYLAMAAGQGSVIVPVGLTLPTAPGDTVGIVGRIFYWARYVDWSFTTPLLLLSLAYTALQSNLRRGGLIAGLLLADLMMIVTAFAFGLSETSWIKWTWFLTSCVAFLAVYYVMWGPMLQENRTETAEVQSDYRRNALILSVLWLIYPIILAFDTDGLGVISSTAGVALIAIIDFVSKVVYGFLSVSSMSKVVSHEPKLTVNATNSLRSAA